ncbi:MAG: transcription-repair coupling factor, partial [Planctomycetota bacterium]|nr:transcription-repair coupling factor [Planctomycetota bacterium]
MPVQPALRLDDWPRLLGQGLEQGDVMLLGARGSALAKCLADSQSQLARPLLIVAPDPEAAGDIHADLVFYLAEHGGGEPPFLWPTWDILPDETESPDLETASDQLAILRSLVKPATFPWVVCPITALLQPTLPPDILARGGFRLGPGKEISPEAVVAHLAEAGLEASPMVEEPGQFSRRGGIVDVFPLLGGQPYRIEFFGDEVDTVRPFSPATQESGAILDSEVVLVDVPREAFRLTGTGGRRHSLLDYLSPATLVVVRHPERSARVAGLYASGFSGLSNTLFPLEQAAARLSPFRKMLLPDLDSDPWPEDPWPRPVDLCPVDLMATGWERLSGNFDTSLRELSQLHQGGTRLCITCNNPAEEKRLREVLTEKAPDLLADIRLAQGHLSRGFIREGDSAYVSDHELFGRQTPIRAPRKRYQGIPITDFAELREGDYVVHVANGIARFEGIKTLERDGAEQDFLNLLFAEDARIYVPLSQIELVQRYIGLGGARPQLSKLGSSAWSRKKATVENAVRDIAQDLLATQARRLSSPGLAIPPDDAMVEEFDASFPYDETPDQLSAMLDICHDQQSVSPMERLLCGDVGFGKTEMAVRAAFRVVNAGRQVAVLVPTTILAEQHYRTFTSRMADYPVRVECLSRFRSPSEQKAIVENVLQGRTDVVIGTHRLLSEDVAFKNLGLVVIDEEQKFGVENKERLKRFRAEVDILTMTATPIPRTLHMSLLGLRDISNLATPPRERHSVKTMVVRYADDIVRRAILRELSRGGQSFFLHNRVHNIDQIAGHLQSLVPEARVAVGHGQMAEGELLDVITRFLDGKVDVLVCTTIIESGVDMPRVNTLMVNYADHFGLSELHQLRGRVGRFRHQAYAYFLVPANRPLSPEAGKRLQALQDYSELGSGFRIAMRDLEIRGAGNLLGVEQSGHIHLIGFDLYCRLLERAVAAGKGEAPEEEAKVELDLGTSAFIPPDYIPSEQQRIEFYRRLLRTRSAEDLAVSHAYVRDRYGVLPAPVERCFADQGLRISMLDNGLISLGRIEGALAVGFSETSEKKGVAALRHAGWRATLLRRQFWRLEPAGKDNSFPADPVRQAEVLLAV